MCCAVGLWIRSLRMCTPMGQEGPDCHPLSHTVSQSVFVCLGIELELRSCSWLNAPPPP